MAKFDADTLRELRDFREVAIRTEKHPASAVVIWVVAADDEVFVRSVRGSKGVGTGTWPPAAPRHWNLPPAGWRFKHSRRSTPTRSCGPAANFCESTTRAPTRSRSSAPRFCRRHCGWSRADLARFLPVRSGLREVSLLATAQSRRRASREPHAGFQKVQVLPGS